jgi:hypothetical protein
MGIQGLLPFLQAIHEPVNVQAYAGRRVAVDVAAWLYRGAHSRVERESLTWCPTGVPLRVMRA